MTFAGPRVYFAMARDGVFFAARPRGCIPPTARRPSAIVAQAVWASLLILTGSGNALLTYTGFSIMLFLGMAVFALFVLRAREPNAPRPFKALGLSNCAGDLHDRLLRDSRERAVYGSGEAGDRRNARRTISVGFPGHRLGTAGLLLLRAAPDRQRQRFQEPLEPLFQVL